jgi:hypothetical protein
MERSCQNSGILIAQLKLELVQLVELVIGTGVITILAMLQ